MNIATQLLQFCNEARTYYSRNEWFFRLDHALHGLCMGWKSKFDFVSMGDIICKLDGLFDYRLHQYDGRKSGSVPQTNLSGRFRRISRGLYYIFCIWFRDFKFIATAEFGTCGLKYNSKCDNGISDGSIGTDCRSYNLKSQPDEGWPFKITYYSVPS